jgi:hypothetical protein
MIMENNQYHDFPGVWEVLLLYETYMNAHLKESTMVGREPLYSIIVLITT